MSKETYTKQELDSAVDTAVDMIKDKYENKKKLTKIIENNIPGTISEQDMQEFHNLFQGCSFEHIDLIFEISHRIALEEIKKKLTHPLPPRQCK